MSDDHESELLEKWREQLRRGGLDLAILLAVASRARYGLEIIRYLQDSTDLLVTEGTIYPILARLTKNGVVEAEWIADESPHPRKYYRLSAVGRKTLVEMIDQWRRFQRKIDRLVDEAEGVRDETE
jgi:PadR family transcriptional regulator PadR